MARKSKTVTEHISGDSKDKKMILKLDPQKHAWVKSIAEATGTTQPKVINLILAEASKAHADDYIEQIQKMHAQESLKKLKAEAESTEAEIKRLTELLDK